MLSNSQSRPYIQTITNIHPTSVWDLKFMPREQCSSNKYAENIYNPITHFPTETYSPSQVISKFHSNHILNPLEFFFLLSATSLLVLAKLPKRGKLIKVLQLWQNEQPSLKMKFPCRATLKATLPFCEPRTCHQSHNVKFKAFYSTIHSSS